MRDFFRNLSLGALPTDSTPTDFSVICFYGGCSKARKRKKKKNHSLFRIGRTNIPVFSHDAEDEDEEEEEEEVDSTFR